MMAHLHIGCEKTGTTSIQAFLALNRGSLSRIGVLLPRNGGFPNATRAALTCMRSDRVEHNISKHRFDSMPEKRRQWVENTWSGISHEIALGRHAHHMLCLSSEYFQTKLITIDEIKTLKECLWQSGVTGVRILLYLRSQLDYAVSRYSTALRSGYCSDTPLPANAMATNLYDYESLLERWAAVFGGTSVTVRRYDCVRAMHGSVIPDMLDWLGIDQHSTSWEMPTHKNGALGQKTQLALRELNRAFDSHGVSREQSMQFRRAIVKKLESLCDSQPYRPLRKDAIQFQKQFDDMNSRIAHRWFSENTLFDIDYGVFPDHHECGDFASGAHYLAQAVVEAVIRLCPTMIEE